MFSFFLLLTICCGWIFSDFVSAGCEDAYNLDAHAEYNKLDVCTIEDELPEGMQVLINWGCRPVWIDDNRFTFLSNIVGDVYLMDIARNEVTLLTGHFSHAGFTRVHPLDNGDLLLVGPREGPELSSVSTSSMEVYEVGRFDGFMSILKAPYDGEPYPLDTHAWEGVAISRETNRISWSDTNKPFFASNIFFTALNYIFAPSNLWTGLIVYDDNGVPSLAEKEVFHRKGWFNFVFHEPQDFRGSNDEEVLFSAYGPMAEGSSDMWIYSLKENRVINEMNQNLAYNEWEGIRPQYDVALFERDPDANNFSGSSRIDMYKWDFLTKTAQVYTKFRRDDEFGLSNAAFSNDGRWVLMSCKPGPDSPGFAIGIVLVDYENYQYTP